MRAPVRTSSLTTAHSASRPSVIACRGSAVRTTTSPCGRGRRPVSWLRVAPRIRSNSSGHPQSGSCTAEPWNQTIPLPWSRTKRSSACSVVVPKPSAGVVVVPSLVHDEDDVEPVEQLVADAAELLQHPHPEPAGRLQQRCQHPGVVPEAPELVVVLDGDPAGDQQDVELPRGFRHASAATDRMYSTDLVVSTAGKYSSPMGPS